MTRGRSRNARVSLFHLGAVALISLAFALWRAASGDPVTDAIEDRLLDLQFQVRGAVQAPDTVTVVAIDERTIDSLGWTPPPRKAIAEAIQRILDMDARVVALDLLFLDQTTGTAELAAALEASDRVVLAAALANRPGSAPVERTPTVQAALDRSAVAIVIGEPQPGTGDAPPHLLLPRPELLRGTTVAHVNIAQTTDRVARRVPLGLWIGDGSYLPSMALEAARRAAGLQRGDLTLRPGRFVGLGERQLPTDSTGSVVINHYGARGAIATVSLIDVLKGRVPPAMLEGRAVVLGATAETLSDLSATPFSADVPGAEIIATLTANLLADDLIVKDAGAKALGVGFALLLGLLAFAGVHLPSLTAAFVAVPLVWVAGAAGLQLAFSEARLSLDAITLLGVLSLSTGWAVVQRFRSQKRVSTELTQERANLSRYISPFLAERLASEAVPDFDQRTQETAVLFVDVIGYTTLVEAAGSDATATFLRELHRLFEVCSTRHRGVISTFEGDGAMIIFGLPEPGPEDAAACMACGCMLLDQAAQFRSAAFPDLDLKLRVSMHSGPATAAVLGGDRHAQVTVTGDTVNVASRLQEIAKQHGAAFVTSRAGLDAANAADSVNAARFAPLALQSVRGRSGQIEVWGFEAQPR